MDPKRDETTPAGVRLARCRGRGLAWLVVGFLLLRRPPAPPREHAHPVGAKGPRRAPPGSAGAPGRAHRGRRRSRRRRASDAPVSGLGRRGRRSSGPTTRRSRRARPRERDRVVLTPERGRLRAIGAVVVLLAGLGLLSGALRSPPGPVGASAALASPTTATSSRLVLAPARCPRAVEDHVHIALANVSSTSVGAEVDVSGAPPQSRRVRLIVPAGAQRLVALGTPGVRGTGAGDRGRLGERASVSKR